MPKKNTRTAAEDADELLGDTPGIGHNSDAPTTADVGGIAGERLRSFIERVEHLEEEKNSIQDDIKDIFAEAKGAGFDTKVMRQIIRLRKMEKNDVQEQMALIRLYAAALGMEDLL